MDPDPHHLENLDPNEMFANPKLICLQLPPHHTECPEASLVSPLAVETISRPLPALSTPEQGWFNFLLQLTEPYFTILDTPFTEPRLSR